MLSAQTWLTRFKRKLKDSKLLRSVFMNVWRLLKMLGAQTWLIRFKKKSKDHSLPLSPINSLDEYIQHKQANANEYSRRNQLEKQLAGSPGGFYTLGYCYVCKRPVNFYSDYSYAFTDAEGHPRPNWREHLRCPSCGLNNRIRAAIQIFEQTWQPRPDDAIYLTEQITPLYHWFAHNYRNVVGSEYLGNKISFGQVDLSGVRNETLTGLTFSDNQFNYIFSFDVFEHIPNYEAAFLECLRCLKPKGALIFTVPFSRDSDKHIIRARLSSTGQVEHILPPEYHGDPLNTSGTLCFYHFGWELLQQLRSMGFASALAYLYWSDEFGHLGHEQIIFVAQKGN
jgi:SAM-dependent methyltransferase